ENLFVEQCSRCDDCIKACPTHILERGRGGFPLVNFSKGECEFCGDCLNACKQSAFVTDWESRSPWQVKASATESCITYKGVVCRTCGEMCDARAIQFSPRVGGVSTPEFDDELCSGCGACVAPCPNNSIKMT
ncbi:MAG: ferredoxin-type protein NapF, partial [Gammaproteobacteria bacterium]|nr:ferredoxin-type protein NapF [Gammaproteobacteria bacterium]